MSIDKEYLQIEREKEWRAELRKKMANKDRTALNRTKIPMFAFNFRIKKLISVLQKNRLVRKHPDVWIVRPLLVWKGVR